MRPHKNAALRRSLCIVSLSTLLAVVLVTPVAHAKMYKWVDENGSVTYSQKKPPDRETTTIDLKGIESADPEARQRLDDAREASEEAENDKEFAAATGKESQARDKRIKENCKIARQNVRVLTNSARIRDKNAAGELYYLDDKAKASKLAQANKQVEDYCG